MRMRRTIAAVLALLLVTPSAYAFNPQVAAVSVAVVATDDGYDGDERAVRNTVAEELVSQLRRRGFDAFELEEAVAGDAHFVVEIVGGDPSSTEYGSVGVNNGGGGLALGVIVARVAAEVHVYDGETLELLSSDHLVRRSSGIVPTGVGIESGPFFAFVALPFIERAKLRRVARSAARDAVSGVVATINGQ